MYVIVRNDISKSYQAAQGGHALAQMALDNPEAFKAWSNGTIVYLKADYDFLSEGISYGHLNDLGLVYANWHEPDMGDQLTAISVYGVSAEDYFKDFKLL